MASQWAMDLEAIFLVFSLCLFASSTHSTVAIAFLIGKESKLFMVLIVILPLSPQGGSEVQTADARETGPHGALGAHCHPCSPCAESQLIH